MNGPKLSHLEISGYTPRFKWNLTSEKQWRVPVQHFSSKLNSAPCLLWPMTINTNDLIVSHHLSLFPFLPVCEQVKRNNPPNYKSSIGHMKVNPQLSKPHIQCHCRSCNWHSLFSIQLCVFYLTFNRNDKKQVSGSLLQKPHRLPKLDSVLPESFSKHSRNPSHDILKPHFIEFPYIMVTDTEWRLF